MDNRLEYPLPFLSVNTDAILIETKNRNEGRFRIKNTGGSILSGYVMSRAACVSFEPAEWEGNDTLITYRFNPEASGLKPGEVLETSAYICSNGGEKKLPVTIKLVKMAIETTQGTTLANIKDFYDYAQEHPINAQRLFTDSEFYMLLLATGYPYMEAYEILHRDTNRERAMDNFFILSKLKQKTQIIIPSPYIEFVRKPNEVDFIKGHFLVQKSDKGFVEVPVVSKNKAPWLSLPVHRLIASDFNEADMVMVNFTIDPMKITGRYAKETVLVGTDEVNIVLKKQMPFSFRLNREAFRFDDAGVIEITNNTGSEVWADVFCKDNFVRFTAKKFPCGDTYQIPFTIKLSTFMSAQLLFRRLPYLKTVIEVKIFYRDKLYKQQLELTVGKWN